MTYSKNRQFAKAAIFGLAAASLISTSAIAQDAGQEIDALAPAASIDLKEVTCWDITTLNEDDRGATMILLYGQAIGEKGMSAISPEAVQVAIVTTIIDCVDKPDSIVHEILSEKMSH
jgi:hypothetical protein